MQLEKQVCSFEQAKTLKELGVNQDAYFNYEITPVYGKKPFDCTKSRLYAKEQYNSAKYSDDYQCAAFTVAELGVMLTIDDDTHFTHGGYNEHSGCWELMLDKRNPDTDDLDKPFICIHGAMQEEETEAEARAAMLIYLLENNLTTAQDVNERLTPQPA